VVNPFPPPPATVQQLPDVAPVPRVWKGVGDVTPGIGAFYCVAAREGDSLDVDREAELRDEMRGMLPVVLNAGLDLNNTYFTKYATRTFPELVIRFIVLGLPGYELPN